MAGAVSKSWAVGIDLGTANIRVAVFRNDKVEIILDEEGSRSMPAIISFNERCRLIGSPARSQLSSNPRNTIFHVMRFLALKFADPEFQADSKHYPFAVLEKNGHIAVRVQYLGEVKEFAAIELLAMILSKAKENAEASGVFRARRGPEYTVLLRDGAPHGS